MSVSAVRVSAKTTAKSAIIFVHGLGDSGEGWSWFPQLLKGMGIISPAVLDATNFVFPNAPTIPISVNGGYQMPGWFDIFEFGNIKARQDIPGFLRSCEVLKALIEEQVNVHNVPREKIIIGGFSQGAAIALATASLLESKVGGVVALSGFCPIIDEIKKLHNKNGTNFSIPVFQGHGTADPIIAHQYGQLTAEFYQSLGFTNYRFKSYPGMAHSAGDDELVDVAKFLKDVL
ncbi:phospholipase/carboxylesterase [Yamadazyma tenuis]|uniref:Acyl-protein thioesterase 1 n=1 Tax=Candida tenuis (strain ATCC 10573 / BCRC 21748 / CBS 615 / JCM 9827 / NBRC 10315 / NRRL Y-1498 / VKM Y-70) TaxID=590646 RepID=G3B9L9_CANTC|nr:Phospholipase/carboxylesterase [Yamadazyma tenuis ATCC 10573]XP_006688871.1 uncharacterized protein CANTEDRAFT_115377 [Yamadazyma tenuis ATCC 10573]EGV62700.1 Phospholipase/carboxylesterase [Yamadazyma tenuis ATCC 10573]EGV62701.1 hypothetical protein CANTEDRAFT_115377 [Yamadazyma tenuis ATCC 10573]WEJ93157.1 phospholipase/carboxylesterase [Yamadazyma tenuis]